MGRDGVMSRESANGKEGTLGVWSSERQRRELVIRLIH
jgi:hypothetical protein